MQAFDKAASFVEVQDVKRSKSFGRLKIIDERRKTWDEVNVKVDTSAAAADIALPVAPKKFTNKFAALLGDDSDDEVKEDLKEDDWEDEDL
ncbi:hypothetical protein NADFUDRAFT_46440 [Nadsonia fulvescens var. elongata DSM 6958]|uniref:Uncharacterized protein n=1 Tax=Nadsonia fulvescens var. elongata DSM 6958 TaxID=857566 RepID=A0A1E3PK68_9ASCO|nr:hypothetical protein NADFUDRAFT_46440 [Nadsonia fulvescens var. elongata DSM 6958]